MREWISVILVSLLACPIQAQTNVAAIKQQAVQISQGNSVEVKLLDGSKLRGQMGTVSDKGFELTMEKKGTIEKQQIGFDRVKSLRDMKHKTFGRSLARGYLIGLIVLGVIAVIVIAACGPHNWCTG